MNRQAQFEAIEPEINAAYDRHISRVGRSTISLDPYALVPLEDYPELRQSHQENVTKWAKNNVDIEPIVKATLLVDAATEENLPWYTARIDKSFDSWQEWNGRWTAEERSHGEIMVRDIEARGIINMSTEWLPIREQNMIAGIHPDVPTLADGIAYVATQELLTKLAHFQSSRIMDERGAKTLRAIGADEGRHYQFYVSALRAFALVAPDIALEAMRRQHQGDNFAMPGQKGIPDYQKYARIIALSGIFDSITILEAQKQTIDEAGLLKAVPITDQGKRDQEWAYGVSSKEDPAWDRKERLMTILRERAAKQIKPTGLRPFILGHTVDLISNNYVAIDS